jgi:hypothetical protein
MVEAAARAKIVSSKKLQAPFRKCGVDERVNTYQLLHGLFTQLLTCKIMGICKLLALYSRTLNDDDDDDDSAPIFFNYN